MVTNGLVQQNSIVLGLEPLHAILFLELVGTTDLANLQLAILHTAARPGQMHVEIHAVDTSSRVVFDAQVDVLLGAVETAGLTKKRWSPLSQEGRYPDYPGVFKNKSGNNINLSH